MEKNSAEKVRAKIFQEQCQSNQRGVRISVP